MSMTAFEQEMGKIARQDNQLKRYEILVEQRRVRNRKIRKATLFALFLGLAAYGILHRDEVEVQFKRLTAKSESAETGTGNKIKGIQAAAEKRAAALDDLAGK